MRQIMTRLIITKQVMCTWFVATFHAATSMEADAPSPDAQGMYNAFLVVAAISGNAAIIPDLLAAGGQGAHVNCLDEHRRTPVVRWPPTLA